MWNIRYYFGHCWFITLWILLPNQLGVCEDSLQLVDGSDSNMQGWRIPMVTPTITGEIATVESSQLPESLAYHRDESNSQEPSRKRQRRPGRKRKRRPQSGGPGNNLDTQTEWQSEQTETYPDNQFASNINKDDIVVPSGGIFAHADVQSQVVRVSPEASARARIRESIQATVANDNERKGPQQQHQLRQQQEHETTSSRSLNKSYRRPYSVAKKEEVEAKQSESNTGNRAVDIKNLLKQSGGLSLSEILQQQNLSLDDLLKGKQKALKALQNTAAPPQHEAWEAAAPTKTTRRIPPPPSRQPHTTTTTGIPNNNRRNVTNRISNFQRHTPVNLSGILPQRFFATAVSTPPQQQQQTTQQTAQQTTQPAPVHESESAEHPMPIIVTTTNKRIASTIPTTTTDSSTSIEIATISNNLDAPGVRRLPIFRTKPIKEVVSAIRPDLNNSASRKRMPMFKSVTNKTSNSQNSPAQIKVSTLEVYAKQKDRPLRFSSGGNVGLRFNNSKNETNILNADLNVNNAIQTKSAPILPAPTTTTTTTTTSATPVSSSTTMLIENARANIRNRLAMRPRLRPTIHLTISTTSTSPASVNDDMSESVAHSGNIIDITTPPPLPAFPPLYSVSSPSNEILTNSPIEYDINRKLNESKPELNVIEVELEPFQVTKTKVASTLEDLFQTDAQDSDDSFEDEIIHSSTSRSYNIAGSNENELARFSHKYISTENNRPFKNPVDVTERNPSLFTDINTRIFDDKTELLDLLEDRRSGTRLVKVLQQRNMTLDELIDHRKRGSSQLHLAEIFWNRTADASETSDEKHNDQLDIVTAFENFPKFNLDNLKSIKPDEIKTDSQGSSYFTSIINIKPTNEIYKEGRSVREPPMMINLASAMVNGKVKGISQSPWSSAMSDDYDMDERDNQSDESVDRNFLDRPASKVTVISPRRAPPPESFHDVDLLENEAARSHDLLDLELSGHGFKRQSVTIESTQMPMGVRSAIAASATIVCISLCIFIVIFLTCRWRQKRRKKNNYSDRFQAIRGRLPILNSRDASPSKRGTSPPIFLYGSRRSSKLNTMDPNSPEVQEYLYEAMRKPFQ